jgi:capsular exopolysaccharide synthesis family protein
MVILRNGLRVGCTHFDPKGHPTPAIQKDISDRVLVKHEANLPRRTSEQASGELTPNAMPPAPIASRASGVLRSLWRRRFFILILTGLTLLPAILYVKLVTPQFTSTSNLLIAHAPITSGADPNSAAALSPEEIAQQRDLITSTPVLAAALAAPGVRDCDPLRDHHDLIEFLKRSLKIQTQNRNEISISVASSDPVDASLIVDSVVRAYSQFLSSLRRNGNTDLTASLRAEKAQQQAQLAAKTADLLRFGEENHVGPGGDLATAGAGELAKLAQNISDAQVEAVNAKAASDELDRALAQDHDRAEKLQQFEVASARASTQATDNQAVINGQLLTLRNRQAEMQQRLMPKNPALIMIQQQIDDLNLQHDAAIQRRALLTAQHVSDLQHAYDDEQRRLLEASARQAEYARRSSELAAMQRVIDDLDQRIARLDAAEDPNTPIVTVLDPAKASAEPTSPNRQRILMLTALAGLLGSSLLAGWLEIGRARGDRLDRLGVSLPVLAELPALPTDFGPIGRGEQTLLDAEPALEAVFQGLNAVVQGAKNRGRGALVLITSPARADGRSTLASNLAVSLAQTRKRVLLIDADLRSPSQAKIFGLGNATGLGTLLEADVSIPITAIHHTGTPSLDVIPAGPLSGNPSELLNSQRFSDLMGDLSERYDYVVLDSPPTVTFTDARIISASCDLTLMVVRVNQFNRRMFQIGCEGLTNVGANLCGLVLNSGEARPHIERSLVNDAIEKRRETRVLS